MYVLFSLNDFIVGSWLELASYVAMLNLLYTEFFAVFSQL